jgi:tetratricopeptide (TPR) repeat protein
MDPTNAQAPAALAITLVHAANTSWTEDQKATYQDAFRHARMAVQTDPRDPQARFALGVTYQNTGFPAEAIAELKEAVRLNPNYGAAFANLSTNYGFLNKPEQALPAIDLALRLMTHDPRRFIWLPCRAVINYLLRNYRPALEACQEALAAKPDFPVAIRYLVATLGQLGRKAEAAAVIPLLRRLDGDIAGSEAYWRRMFNDAAVRHLVDGLRKAGFE